MEKIEEVIAREVVETALKGRRKSLASSLESACAGLGQGRQPYHDPDSRQHRALHKEEQQREMQELQRGKVQQDRGWQVHRWQSPSHLKLPVLQRQCLLPASLAVRAPLVTNQRHQQGEGPSLSPSWGALSWPSARTHQIPKYKQCGISRFGGDIQAAVFIVHFAALCVAEKDPAWLGLSSEDSAYRVQ